MKRNTIVAVIKIKLIPNKSKGNLILEQNWRGTQCETLNF
jgi:hypothetical protein